MRFVHCSYLVLPFKSESYSCRAVCVYSLYARALSTANTPSFLRFYHQVLFKFISQLFVCVCGFFFFLSTAHFKTSQNYLPKTDLNNLNSAKASTEVEREYEHLLL